MSNKVLIKVPLKNILNVSRVITINRYHLAPTYRNRGEVHDFWELVYVEDGVLRFHADEETGVLRAGEVIFHKPNEFHNVECDGKRAASIFIMTFDCHSGAMKYFCKKKATVPPNLTSLIQRLIDESTRNFKVSSYPLMRLSEAPIGGEQLIRIYLEEFLIRMMRSEEKHSEAETVFTSRESLENTLVREMCTYLATHTRDKVTLADISERFHFGKSHLCDVFKKSTGYTIVQYHLKLKITEAKRLLRDGSMTVSDVAEYLGFESAAYFSRTFRKHAGMSPTRFCDLASSDAAVYLETDTPLL